MAEMGSWVYMGRVALRPAVGCGGGCTYFAFLMMLLPSVAKSLQLGVVADVLGAELGQGDGGGERGAALEPVVAG